MEYEITPRKCSNFDPNKRDVIVSEHVAASTTNGKKNTSACGLTSPQYLRKTVKTMPDQISVENFVQNA